MSPEMFLTPVMKGGFFLKKRPHETERMNEYRDANREFQETLKIDGRNA